MNDPKEEKKEEEKEKGVEDKDMADQQRIQRIKDLVTVVIEFSFF